MRILNMTMCICMCLSICAFCRGLFVQTFLSDSFFACVICSLLCLFVSDVFSVVVRTFYSSDVFRLVFTCVIRCLRCFSDFDFVFCVVKDVLNIWLSTVISQGTS
jgi:hypothetical protein